MRIHTALAFPMLWLALGQASAVPQAPQASSPQGLTVVRDAETGELRAPTAAELKSLQSQPTSRPRASALPQPQAVTGTRGETSVVLGERKLVYTVVKRGVDGKLDHHCVDGARAAGTVLEQPAANVRGEHRHDHR